MIGYQDEWSAPTDTRTINFSSLPPGEYQFEVQYSMDDKVWSAAASTNKIILQTKFTETILFLIIVVLASLLIIACVTTFFIKSYFKRRTRAQQQRAQLQSLKLQTIRSKAIPHFSGNVYNNIDYLISKGLYEDASRYLGLMSRLHNQLLLDADKACRSIEEELQFVKYYLELEQLRFKEKFLYHIHVEEEVNLLQHAPNMILHTYVENAIKHGIMRRGFGNLYLNIFNAAAKEFG